MLLLDKTSFSVYCQNYCVNFWTLEPAGEGALCFIAPADVAITHTG